MTAGDGVLARVRRVRSRHLGVDTRALAALRVGLGCLLVADLLGRARDLRAFYTDFGVLPRATLATVSSPWRPSLHALSGDLWFQALLFAVAGVAALALALGWRTRTATVVSWLLLVSLHNRNPVVLNGGDVLLRMVLLWAVFLPLGERLSVDARRRDRAPRDRVASLAAAGLLLQVVTMYTVNAALKLAGDRWLAGTAIRYVFSLEQFTTPLGDALAGHPTLLVALDHAWLALVTASVLLVVLRGWPRAAFAAALAGGHLSMWLTMRLGLFPFVACVALLAVLPPVVWDAVERRARRLAADRRPLAAADRLLPALPTSPPSGPTRERLATLAVCLVLVLALAGVVQPATTARDRMPDAADPALDAATAASPAVDLFRTDQYWTMFAPEPMRTDGWYVVPGRLTDGSRVDALHGGPVRWAKPDHVQRSYPNARWRKYLVNLQRPGFSAHRPGLAGHLCRRWNATHETGLAGLDLYYVEQPGRLSGPEPTERVGLESHRCGTTGR
jgi:type II secretory pathway component PulM